MNTPPPPDISRPQRLALVVYMFLTTATVGFVQPFVALYLEAAGLTRDRIGIVTGAGTALALLVQPFLGRLSDRLDARRPLMVIAAILSGTAYLAYRSAEGWLAFLPLSALAVNGAFYLGSAGGVLVGRLTAGTGRGGAAYAGFRVWGSVGYIVVAQLAGWLLAQQDKGSPFGRAELNAVFTYGPLLYFAIAVVALFVPDRRSALPAPRGATNAPEARPPLSPNMRVFLLAYFLYNFGLYGATAYLSLYMKQFTSDPRWLTGMFSAGVLCEVLVMTRVGRFTDTYGRRPALALTFLLMPLRLLLYIPATGPLWVLAVQSLHGFNFGIMGTIAIVFINDLATDRDRGAAQARLSVIGGLASALGPILCGRIAQSFGLGWMFAAMSAVGAAAAFVFVTRVQESHPAPASLTARFPAALHPLLRLLAAPPR